MAALEVREQYSGAASIAAWWHRPMRAFMHFLCGALFLAALLGKNPGNCAVRPAQPAPAA